MAVAHCPAGTQQLRDIASLNTSTCLECAVYQPLIAAGRCQYSKTHLLGHALVPPSEIDRSVTAERMSIPWPSAVGAGHPLASSIFDAWYTQLSDRTCCTEDLRRLRLPRLSTSDEQVASTAGHAMEEERVLMIAEASAIRCDIASGLSCC